MTETTGAVVHQPLKYRADTVDWADLEPGEFCYRPKFAEGPKWLAFWPVKSQTALMVPINPQRSSNGSSWHLTGTEALPTLKPSVNDQERWHGFLTDGVATP